MPAFIDLTGKTFHYATAIERVANRRENVTYWLWRCICGKTFEAAAHDFKTGRRKSCGCKSPNRFVDISGQRFGLWVVMKRSEEKHAYWDCRCDCGSERDVYGQNLRNGFSKSCGCIDTSGDNNHRRQLAKNKHGADYVERENPWYDQASGIFSRSKAAGIENGFKSICELASYLMSICPSHCPVFDVPFVRGSAGFSPYAPTVDRKDNSLGYVRGNLQVISMKANGMKANASDDEMKMFAEWIVSHQNQHANAGWSAGLVF